MAVVISAEVIVGAIGFVVGAGAAAAVAFRRTLTLLRPLKPLGFMLEDWNGVPDRRGVPGRPGVMERLAGHDEALASIQRELTANGGSSLRDAIAKIEERTRSQDSSVALLASKLDILLLMQQRSEGGGPNGGVQQGDNGVSR